MKKIFDVKNNQLAESSIDYKNNQLAESPIYCNKNNNLYWVDIIGKTVKSWNDYGLKTYNLNIRPTSIGLTNSFDILFITLENNVGYLDLRTGKIDYFYKSVPLLNEGYRLNDGKVLPSGKGYLVGSMNENGLASKGQLYDINKDKSFILRNIGTNISNGICWDKNQNLFYADSTEKKIYRVDNLGMMDEMNWNIEGEPDGSCTDVNNRMYNAEYGASKISIYNLDNLKKESEIQMPCERPTCPCWGGVDKNILFCSSAIDDKNNGGEIYYEKFNKIEGELTHRFVLPFGLI